MTLKTSRYNSVFDTFPKLYPLATIAMEMKKGNATLQNHVSPIRTLKDVTLYAREILEVRGREPYDLIKQGMPQFAPAETPHGMSGLCCLEYDDSGVDTAHAFAIAAQNPHVVMIWRSLSEKPKILVRIDTENLTRSTFPHAWLSAAQMFEEFGEADTSASYPHQKQNICYDPDLFLNLDVIPLKWEVDDEALSEVMPQHFEDIASALMDELGREYIDALENMEYTEQGVGRQRVPCPFGGNHANDGWGLRSNGTRVIQNGKNDWTLQCFKCSTRKRFFEIPSPKKAPPRLVQPSKDEIDALINKAPPTEVRERPSFRHFFPEERIVCREVLETSPDAGWHGKIPIWTPKYENLHPLTDKFALNGHPREIEKRRVWSTLFDKCPHCGGMTAKWIDRYMLTAGYYCEGCHKDYMLGSYLEIELNRKLRNSILSKYQGYLGDNPDFEDFRLFQPGILTYVGSGMGTGKTTEGINALVQLALQGLGRGIIVVPRIALAIELAYQLRAKHGYNAWGLWTEGAHKDEKFIGEFGAIACFPSLPQVVNAAEVYGVGKDQLYVIIDELDFSYELLTLDVIQSPRIKKILRDTLKSTGLVVMGQTESTLALEAFAQESEAEEVQGFYNIAPPAEGHVELKEHGDETNINALLASGIDDISEHLQQDNHLYVFCESRRDVGILADKFSHENPLEYTAYTRGTYRPKQLLRHQRLTDSRLFIGTSAAGVGISFLDKKAKTIIIGGLTFGDRYANMKAQEAMRDRGRRGMFMHYKPYNLSLPVRPTEVQERSLYHESLKQVLENPAMLNLPTHAIAKYAAARAFASFANFQFEAFMRYHVGVVGNMEVVYSHAATQPENVVEAIKVKRSEIRQIENELKIDGAKEILNTVLSDTDTELLTSSEIRRARNQGQLSTDAALAHELANEATRAVGWDDVVNRFSAGDPLGDFFTEADIDVAGALAERKFDFAALTKKRAGYFAVNAPKWTATRFELEVAQADKQLVFEGFGIEITAVEDNRFRGELLTKLLDTLVGQVFDTQSLCAAVKRVFMTTASTGKTYLHELRSGALGDNEYRQARFLHCAEDESIVVNWLARFISEWYPARLAKRQGFYALQPDSHAQLYLRSFERWLLHQPGVFDRANIQLDIFEPVDMPESNAELKAEARQRRKNGDTLKAIAADLGFSAKTVHQWCEGIEPQKQTKATRKSRQEERQSTKQANKQKKQERNAEVLRRYDGGKGDTQQQITDDMGIGLATVNRIIKKREV